MFALTFDTAKQDWASSRGFLPQDVPEPVIDEKADPADARAVIIKVRYAGLCGTDRGIWYRAAMRDQILGSLQAEGKTTRTIGHECSGDIVAVGSAVTEQYHLKAGDFVACESHVVCETCYQCERGEKHVCTNEKILGISHDGIFAEYAKVPAHIVWKTNEQKVRPEIAAVQEPFGNAVHAATKVDLRGKNVAIFGLGPIGLFATLVARGMGAKKIIGIEPNPKAREMAARLGIDELVALDPSAGPAPKHDPRVTDEVLRMTDGIGADVSLEMAGFNDSMNNALYATRRGGDVVLFGIKAQDFLLEDYNKLILRGLTLHAVIGRELWRTWDITRSLMEDAGNGIQEKIWDVIYEGGKETILPIREYNNETFEGLLNAHPKLLFKVA